MMHRVFIRYQVPATGRAAGFVAKRIAEDNEIVVLAHLSSRSGKQYYRAGAVSCGKSNAEAKHFGSAILCHASFMRFNWVPQASRLEKDTGNCPSLDTLRTGCHFRSKSWFIETQATEARLNGGI